MAHLAAPQRPAPVEPRARRTGALRLPLLAAGAAAVWAIAGPARSAVNDEVASLATSEGRRGCRSEPSP